MKFRWPLAFASTVDHYRLNLIAERERNNELSRSLANALTALHQHKTVLGERSSTFKRAVEKTMVVKQ